MLSIFENNFAKMVKLGIITPEGKPTFDEDKKRVPHPRGDEPVPLVTLLGEFPTRVVHLHFLVEIEHV